MDSKHRTPTLWTYEAEPNGMTFSLWYDDDTNIGEVLDAEDAAFIVKAVNAHDDLLNALLAIRARVYGMYDDPALAEYISTDGDVSDVLSIANSAIGKVYDRSQ